jgi:hypothetical protein
LLPPDVETPDAQRPRPEGAARVVVAGATARSRSAQAARMLSSAFGAAGSDFAAIKVVHAGSTLDGMNSACTDAVWRFVIITGSSAAMLTSAFAMVKAIDARRPGVRIELFVTGKDESRAHPAYQRVRAAAERFLGREVGFAGALTDLEEAPADASDEADAMNRRATRASRSARMWAARLLAECSEGAWQDAAHSMN